MADAPGSDDEGGERGTPTIVVGHIEPIEAKNLRLGGAAKVSGVGEAITVAAGPAIAKALDIFTPTLVDEVHVDAKTVDRASEIAERLIKLMPSLPWTEQASDLLTMAFTIRHFRNGGT